MKTKQIPFRGKKSFTLLEVVISVTILLIILVFLYKALDDMKINNNKFEQHLSKNDNENEVYKVFLEDIAESKADITFDKDRDKNSIVSFKTTNSYFNSFYQNITYMVSSYGNLVRIESKEKFERGKSSIEFYKNSYIYRLVDDIEKFIVLHKDDKVVFIIKQKGKPKTIYSTFKM